MARRAEHELRLRRIDNEDQFTERKPKTVSSEDICKTLVAFANSLRNGEEGVLFIGVSDQGEVTGVDETDKFQKRIRRLAEGTCYPPIRIQMEILNESDLSFLAVIVRSSNNKPHFAGQAFVRIGSESVSASPEVFEELIASRNDKARQMLCYRDCGTTVLLELPSTSDPGFARVRCKVTGTTTHYATFVEEGSGTEHSIALEDMRLKLAGETPLIIEYLK